MDQQDDGVALQTSMELDNPPPDIETLMESVVKVSPASLSLSSDGLQACTSLAIFTLQFSYML